MVVPPLLKSMFSLTNFDLGLCDCCYCVCTQWRCNMRGTKYKPNSKLSLFMFQILLNRTCFYTYTA